MTATVQVRRWTGAAGAQLKDNILTSGTNLATDDVHSAAGGTSNPIPVPGSGTTYSFWVSFKLYAASAPTGTINNLRAFFESRDRTGDPTGIVWLGQEANVGANSGYRQATGDVGVTGTQLTTVNHTGLTTTPVDPVASWTPSTPKSLAGSISSPNIGDFGSFLVMQVGVTSAFPNTGALPNEGLTFRYDET